MISMIKIGALNNCQSLIISSTDNVALTKQESLSFRYCYRKYEDIFLRKHYTNTFFLMLLVLLQILHAFVRVEFAFLMQLNVLLLDPPPQLTEHLLQLLPTHL